MKVNILAYSVSPHLITASIFSAKTPMTYPSAIDFSCQIDFVKVIDDFLSGDIPHNIQSLVANQYLPKNTARLKMTSCMSDRWQVNLPPKKSCNPTSQLPRTYINSGLLLNIN